jgi:hypothetical protein
LIILSAVRPIIVIGILLLGAGYAADLIGPIIGPIEYTGFIGFEYPEGENPIINIVFTVDPKVADKLLIVEVPSPWSHTYSSGTLTLSGGSLNPGGTLSVKVSLKEYVEAGEYLTSSIGTTSAGESSTAIGPLLVSQLYLLGLLDMAKSNQLPLIALVTGLTLLEILLNRRSGEPSTTAVSKKPGDCQELIDKCKKARDAAKTAEAEALSAKQEADVASQALEKSKKDVQKSQKNLNDAQKTPSEKDQSWVEMDGRRITSDDLNLRRDASKGLWDKYRRGEIDAETLENEWERLGDHEALEELRKKSREARKEKAEKDLEAAKKQEKEAEEKAQKTKQDSESAQKKADEAKALADKACKEADDCLKALAQAKAALPVIEDEPQEEEPETTEDTTEETIETTETYETTTETYETTTETYETTTETYETTTETYETTGTTEETTLSTEETEKMLEKFKEETTFFGPRLGESNLKPKTIENMMKESPSLYGTTRSRHEYRSAPGGAWADFWGTGARMLKMGKGG